MWGACPLSDRPAARLRARDRVSRGSKDDTDTTWTTVRVCLLAARRCMRERNRGWYDRRHPVAGGTGGSVMLTNPRIPTTCLIGGAACNPANYGASVPGSRPNTDCVPAGTFNPCQAIVTVPTSSDCTPDDTYNLPAAVFNAPPTPNEIKVNASGLSVALRCTMAVDSGGPDGVGVPDQASTTPSSLLPTYNIQISGGGGCP